MEESESDSIATIAAQLRRRGEQLLYAAALADPRGAVLAVDLDLPAPRVHGSRPKAPAGVASKRRAAAVKAAAKAAKKRGGGVRCGHLPEARGGGQGRRAGGDALHA